MSLQVVASGSQTCVVKAITGSTQATPVVVTATGHGFSNGDRINIADCDVTALNGFWTIQNVAANTFELVGSTNPGASATTGTCGKEFIVHTTTAIGIYAFQVNMTPQTTGDASFCVMSGKVISAGAFVDFQRDAHTGAQTVPLHQHNPPLVVPFQARFSILQYKGTARTYEWSVCRIQ